MWNYKTLRAREYHAAQKEPRKGIWCGADNFNIYGDCLKLSAACKHECQAQSAAGITSEDRQHHQTALSAAELRRVQSPALSLPPML